ncbi:MAG: hypothetical protein A3A80_02735 [Candidatus Terrybacteria bacterium RIFCSPLOWO2_01_FULL_44_24]|uniref:Gram-positive cocci surface proteins LPxTG domain-containing protein n=1 Tax=Candidatus Terrybacteria bacterium RIFCSPHIGHO2_01_FULL_43_35 TaxID=1802361 RepID=A0A1G2PEL1_9BACT|nr:MAG: hypothetical protein A2828_02525 [Candidatus Terrybacteria bacterium RIFCSPHIGHO2_01_FULL_43_35]OHA50985.1 MAG: hypothetical protein A3A80_02735 [Candidatus Terrybacteria bacterium RIFCSPLOWO2_01_FULL_44_24]
MRYILSLLTLAFLSTAPLIGMAHESDQSHEEPETLEKRAGSVNPVAVGIFGAAIAGAGGYFIWLKLKKK